MKMVVLLFSFLLSISSVSAHNANVKGYNKKDSEFISSCNNKNYGYHKQNGKNHWHEVNYKNKEWKIIDSNKLFENDPCLSDNNISASLVKCVDGDTAVFNLNGEETKIRFLAVDTPESVHPTKEVEMYAKEASKNTCDLLSNASSIIVEYDNNSDRSDKYGRNLAWIWIDGMLLQKLMIGEGFARVAYIYGNYKYLNDLCAVQQQAINDNKGIWQYNYDIGYCETKKTNSDLETGINNVYKVTFKNKNDNRIVTVAEGMTVKKIDAKERIGYEFLGWYHDGHKYDFNAPVNGNIVLEARYKINYIYIIAILILIIMTIVKDKGGKVGKVNKKGAKRNRKKWI